MTEGKRVVAELLKECSSLKDEGKWEESSGRYAELLRDAEGLGDAVLELEALLGLAECEMNRCNYRDSADMYMRAMKKAETMGNIMTRAAALRGLGYIHWRKGDTEMAMEYYGTALDLLTDARNMELIAKTHVDLGNVRATREELQNAEDHYRKAIQIHVSEPMLPKYDLARAYNNLGDLKIRAGYYAESIEFFEKCIAVSRDTNDTSNLGWALFNGAEALSQLGNLQKACIYLDEARKCMLETDDKLGLACVLRIRGIVSQKGQEYKEARENLEASLDIIRELDIPEEIAMIQHNLGQLLLEMGLMDEAKAALKEAKEIYKEIGSKRQSDVANLMAEHGLL